MPEVEVRFYAELNDFLPPARRQRSFRHRFMGTPAVKDVIESLGPPHTEVELILVDGEAVGWDHRLHGGERVAVYPVFEEFALDALLLHPAPLRRLTFAADGHLGRLARYLRLLGFDTWYRPRAEDAELAALAEGEGRILLTRDRGLLKRSRVERGYLVRMTDPALQLREVAHRFHLERDARPFSRCLRCNEPLEPLAVEEAVQRVPPRVAAWCREFHRCPGCGRIYWPGSHYQIMLRGPVAVVLEGALGDVPLVSYGPPTSGGDREEPSLEGE